MDTIRNTLFIGKVHQHFQQLDSTNKYALDLISKNNPTEGTVISTYDQTQGRGQIGSKWESSPGMNLTLSLILYPHFLIPRQQFSLNQAISLGLHDFMSLYLSQGLKIKWSNDLYVGKRKISGMLLQNSLTSHKIISSVVGLGININQRHFSAAIPNPTSLSLVTGKEYSDLDLLLKQLCQCLEKRYLQLKSGDVATLHHDYLQNLYQFNEEARYQRPDGTIFSGTISGLDASGKLVIQHANGHEAFGLKEITFLH